MGESCCSSCGGARLHSPSTALSFMHESVEPNSLGSGEGQSQAFPQEGAPIDRQHLKLQSAHLDEMRCLRTEAPGEARFGWMERRWGFASHLRRLEGRRSVKDAVDSSCVNTPRKYTVSSIYWSKQKWLKITKTFLKWTLVYKVFQWHFAPNVILSLTGYHSLTAIPGLWFTAILNVKVCCYDSTHWFL